MNENVAILDRVEGLVKPESERDDAVRRILPLLKEYAEKFAFWCGSNVTAYRTAYTRTIPPARQLAQFTSQRLQSVKDDVLRLEAALRLAELEGVLAWADAWMLKHRDVP